MIKTARIAVSNAAIHFDKVYSYAVPERLQNVLQRGSMVLVPFGKASRPRMGVVITCSEEEPDEKLKQVFDAAPETARLTEDLMRLVLLLKESTFCTYYEAVKAVIPYGAQYRPETAPDGSPFLKKQLVRHTEKLYTAEGSLPSKPRPTVKQRTCMALLEGGPMTEAELKEQGISAEVADNLCRKGVISCRIVNRSADLYKDIPYDPKPVVLSEEQEAAYRGLLAAMKSPKPKASLLYGVTGSGKTLVFLKLIEQCLQMGRKALVLVPEIGLTPQMIRRLRSTFGSRVAVQHSALNHTERLLQWQMIQDGGADIVVGTRSAVFAPLTGIGLIIMDEEQEHTYRSESAPRYSAHSVAARRAADENALLLLASATPSIESYHAALNGRLQLFRLSKRYGGNPLPSVDIVDMREEMAEGNPGEISRTLETAVRRTLDSGRQAILLLNRRGYNTSAQCEQCRAVLKCEKCSVPMVWHKASGRLLCHYCGSEIVRKPEKCPSCGGRLNYRGFGTQKAEEELAMLFPDARILRMDQDSTAAKDAHETLLRRFSRHEYDIMVGTQMVAKGLDFEDVTLVGVLGIDSLLYAQGFRAYENVFSLVTQVVGRGGRSSAPGHAVIQTTDPENPVLRLAAAQDYDAFYSEEDPYRRLGLYPPYCRLCVVGFSGKKEEETAQAAARFSRILAEKAAGRRDIPLRILGPAPASVAMINEHYRYRLTLKSRGDKAFRDLLREALKEYEEAGLPRMAALAVDTNSDGDI